MARRKKGIVLDEDAPTVDISSLIDVCFLLLIYFIVTSTIARQESDLILTLPSSQSSSDSKPDIDPAFFLVKENGTIQQVTADQGTNTLSGAGAGEGKALKHRKPEDLDRVDKFIGAYKALAADRAMVKVKAEPNSKAQYVIDLLNILAKHEIDKITFTEYAE